MPDAAVRAALHALPCHQMIAVSLADAEGFRYAGNGQGSLPPSRRGHSRLPGWADPPAPHSLAIWLLKACD
jgi:hypothetical protein